MEHSFDINIAKQYGIETRPQAEIDSLLKEWRADSGINGKDK